MGWEFQWRAVDAILARRPDVVPAPILLRCPYQVCLDRIDQRHREDPSLPGAADLLTVPHIRQVRQFLDDLDRPDVHVIDADRPPEAVFADARDHLTGRLPTRLAG
jgi:thymidylate kinase